MNTFLSKAPNTNWHKFLNKTDIATNYNVKPLNSELKISIVTIALNSAATIKDTIESVLNQTYPNVEYIVVDGNSSDDTLEIIKSYEDRFNGRLRWISEPDNGLYDAMNKGIKLATGDLVGILNSDDFYHRNNSIELVVQEFFEKENIECVYADVRLVSALNVNKSIRYYSSAKFSTKRFRFGFMPAHPTFFTYRKNFDKYGFYQTDYVIAADYELLVRYLYVYNLKYSYLPVDLLKMRIGGRSTASIRYKLKFDSEIVRACKTNGIYTNTFLILFRGIEKIYEFFNTKDNVKF